MGTSHSLVVYYSRTGTTERLAEAIAQVLQADLERLEDTVNRAGPWGFVRSLRDAIGRRGASLKRLKHNPADYEQVLIGTPDWGKSVAAPVRTFLSSWCGRLPRVAFFLTDGRADHAMVFREMASLVGQDPVAVLGVPQREVREGEWAGAVATFVEQLTLGQAAQGTSTAAP